MMFRSIIFSAVAVGLVISTIYSVFQQFKINPIIYSAEKYERLEISSDISNHHPWSPNDGLQRIGYTFGSNALIGISFSIIMISIMTFHNCISTKPIVNALSGLGWGIAMMITMFVSPVLYGLHPEIPGTNSAELVNRQIWWMFCSVTTAISLLILYYAHLKWKVIGLCIMCVPVFFEAPLPDQISYLHTNPEVVHVLTDLTHQFLLMTTIGLCIFYGLLGILSGYMTKRYVIYKY